MRGICRGRACKFAREGEGGERGAGGGGCCTNVAALGPVGEHVSTGIHAVGEAAATALEGANERALARVHALVALEGRLFAETAGRAPGEGAAVGPGALMLFHVPFEGEARLEGVFATLVLTHIGAKGGGRGRGSRRWGTLTPARTVGATFTISHMSRRSCIHNFGKL